MKSQREIYQALLDGKTLKSKSNTEVSLSDKYPIKWAFEKPENWEIVEKPTLYYRWKRKANENTIEITKYWYKEGIEPSKVYPWIRIEPGKTFEEIT